MSDYSDDYEWEDDGLNYDHGFAPCESCGSTAEVCLCDTSYNGVFDDMSADEDDEDDEDESERLVLADDPVMLDDDDEMELGEDVLEAMRKHAGVELVDPLEWLDRSPVERARETVLESMYIKKWAEKRLEHEREINQPVRYWTAHPTKAEFNSHTDTPIDPGDVCDCGNC